MAKKVMALVAAHSSPVPRASPLKDGRPHGHYDALLQLNPGRTNYPNSIIQ